MGGVTTFFSDLWMAIATFFNPGLGTESPTMGPASGGGTTAPSRRLTISTPVPTPSPTLRPTSPNPTQAPTISAQPSAPTLSPTVTSWRLYGREILGEVEGDAMGWAVAFAADGQTIAMGAHRHETTATSISEGQLRVFRFDAAVDDWQQLGSTISGAPGDVLGYSVALSRDGRTVAASAIGADNFRGHVRVYVFENNPLFSANRNDWVQQGQNIEGEFEGDQLGFNVDLNAPASIVAASAVYNVGLDLDAGSVRVLGWNAIFRQWRQIGQDLDGVGRGDFYGRSVNLSAMGTVLAVGSHRNDALLPDAGVVQAFTYNARLKEWIRLGSSIFGVAPGDRAGYAVDMTADGQTLVVGAYANDNSGYFAGHARVFRYDPLQRDWFQLGQELLGERFLDEYGKSVAITPDGRTIAIGGRKNDDAGDNAGHVRVFDFNDSTQLWEQVGPDLNGDAPGDYFGGEQAVVLSEDGRFLGVGARFNDGNGRDSGQVQVFQRF